MKRVIAFIFIALICGLIPFLVPHNFDYVGLNAVTFVTSDKVEEDKYSVIKSGDDYFVTTDSSSAKELAKKINIKGYSLHFDIECGVEKLKAQFIDFCMPEINASGVRVFEGYTSMYNDFRIVDGKKINVQMAVLQDEIIIGFPLILTGF